MVSSLVSISPHTDLVRDQKAISQNGTEDHPEVQSLRQEVESQRQKVECPLQEGESLNHPNNQQAYTGPPASVFNLITNKAQKARNPLK